MRQYQQALLDLHEFEKQGGGRGARRAELQARVRDAYNELNRVFRSEIERLVPRQHFGKNRGNALTSAERGITLASRRKGRGLHVADQGGAVRIGGFAKAIKFVGNGAIVLDAGIRAHGVYTTYQQGGNWQRQAVVQATGFGLGGAVGLYVGEAVVGSLVAVGLAATPLGWLVVMGAGVAVGLGAANAADFVGGKVAESVWDRNW